MLRRLPLLTTALVLGACMPAERAPLGLDDATTYLFTNFEGDATELALVVGDLETEMDSFDLTADDVKNDRARTLDVLTEDELGGATMPPDADPEEQIATVVLGRSEQPMQAQIDLALEDNHVCIESNTTRYYGRTFLEGQDCFGDGSCAFLRTDNEVRKENFLAKAWYDLFKDYRRITLEDGREVMLSRSWSPESYPSDNGSGEFTQSFTIEAWIPDPDGGVKRMYGMWTEINIGLPDDLMQGQIIDGIDEGFYNAEQFMAGDTSECDADRDREYDRETE